MKRSRSQSSAERSSSVDDESSDSSNTETSASYDLHESEESSPPPSAPVRAKPESKDRDNYAKRSSSDKASIVPKKVKDENTSHSIRKKVHPSASHNKSKPSKERKSNHTSKPKVIEVIDSSASEYNPSDEDDGSESSSCSENESETQTRQPEKPAYKIPKNEIKHDPESVPAIKKVKARPEATLKKHTSRETKSEGSKEISRFSREEDAAIIAFFDQSVRTVDLMKHLHESFPDRQPRSDSSVNKHRKSLIKRCKEFILGTKS